MYWSRSENYLDVLIYVILSLSWMVGGLLLVSQSKRFGRRERLPVGIGFGLLFYILIANGLGQIFPSYPSFIFSSLIVLFAGLFFARNSLKHIFRSIGIKQGLQFIPLFFMTVVFTMLMRGLGLGDDYAHLPLVSTLATGDIPPHYSLYPDILLPYHYGLDLFAASAVRVAGFFPWSAWDISRAFVAALTLLCAWLWLQRITKNRNAAFLGTFLLAFGMGTRWALTLLPHPWIADISTEIQLIGSSLDTGNTLFKALYNPWVIAGGPPVPIPFAFVNGIFSPLTFTWGGAASLPILAMVLILMMAGRRPLASVDFLLLGGALLSLALSAEHIFVLSAIGIGSAALIMIFYEKRTLSQSLSIFSGQFIVIAIVSVILSFIQGGVLTELLRTHLMGTPGVGAASTGSFLLRWPPTFFDAHLGSLSILNWRQLIVLLAECGPVLFLFPIIVLRMRDDFRHHRTLELGLAIASFLGIIIPVFVQYGVSRDIVRLTGFGLSIWLLLGMQSMWRLFKRASLLARTGMGFAYLVTILGGVTLFAYQSTAILNPQISDFIGSMDTRMSQLYWDRLDAHAVVFGPTGFREQALFGRLSVTSFYDGQILGKFLPYLDAPDLFALHKLGVGYVYIDKRFWDRLSPVSQKALYAPCAKVMKRMEKYNSATKELHDFRVLIDISACK